MDNVELVRDTDERYLGMAAGVLQVVRRVPELSEPQLTALQELSRTFVARVGTAPTDAADDAFRLAFASRAAGPLANRTQATWAQLMVCRAVREKGLAFEASRPPVPEIGVIADIVVRSARIAMFVDDCRAHGCPAHRVSDQADRERRGAAVIAHDRAVDRLLEMVGWTVLRAWEHNDPRRTAERLMRAVARVDPA